MNCPGQRIKEHKTHLASDRTSCHRWEANQFRLLLLTAAYWLMLDLRNVAPKKSRWRKATFETIRMTFLKIAAGVETLKTRIRVSFPDRHAQHASHRAQARHHRRPRSLNGAATRAADRTRNQQPFNL